MTSLQSQVTSMELALQEVTERHAKEKKRRQELHNILMVSFSETRPALFEMISISLLALINVPVHTNGPHKKSAETYNEMILCNALYILISIMSTL